MKIVIASLFLLGAISAATINIGDRSSIDNDIDAKNSVQEDEHDCDRSRMTSTACRINDLKNEFLVAHNMARAQHVDTAAVGWSDSLAKQAENYALELVKTDKFEHSPGSSRGGQGENLMMGSSPAMQIRTVDLCVTKWYEEGARFDYDMAWQYNLEGSKGLGHFTAMVWQSTTTVGCGGAYKDTPKGRVTKYVCRYTPQGNVPGGFHELVKRLKPGKKFPTAVDEDFFKLCVNDSKWNKYCLESIAKTAGYCTQYKAMLLGKCNKTCRYGSC